ncbi:MAG: ExbD/TolR family protein [Planctomycetota bacterium]|jgi:biopolymer transport protein ExbD
MAKRKQPKEEEPVNFIMTPMIDIVFQLIIFFMLVMDLSRQRLEPVVLPYASKAIKEKFNDETLLILNVMKDGTVKIDGRTYWRPSYGDNNDKLIAVFQRRRQKVKYQEVPGNDKYVKYPLLLRADRSTEFLHLQKILMIATKEGGVTRIQFAAKKEK